LRGWRAAERQAAAVNRRRRRGERNVMPGVLGAGGYLRKWILGWDEWEIYRGKNSLRHRRTALLVRHRPGFRRVAFRAIATSAAAGAAHRFGAGWSRATEPPQESQASDWREPVLRRSVGAVGRADGYSAALLKPVLSRRLDGSLAACAYHPAPYRSSSLSCATHRPSAIKPASLKVSTRPATLYVE